MSTARRPKTAGDLQVPLGRPLEAFGRQVREFLAHAAPPKIVREHVEAPFDPGLWAAMSGLDLMATLVPDAYAGAGGSLGDGVVLMEELGRALVPAPFLSSAVLGAIVLGGLADEDVRAALLPRIADGSLRVTFAHAAALGDLRLAGGTATGVLRRVIDGDTAESILAVSGHQLVGIDRGSAGTRFARDVAVDPLRPVATVVAEAAPARMLGTVEHDALGRARARIATLVAAEMTGGARRCLELSTEWARLREQFGQPIGAFQAIKHRCVDMLVAVEAATAGTRLAARLADAGSPDHAAAALLALTTAGRAYRDVAAGAIQIHGGMGYVWEHEAHFHLKRAKGNEYLFGSVAANRARLAAALGV